LKNEPRNFHLGVNAKVHILEKENHLVVSEATALIFRKLNPEGCTSSTQYRL
jgi:hypothetical protein